MPDGNNSREDRTPEDTISQIEKISIDDAVRAAVALHKQGHLEEADIFYQGVLEEVPDHADALHFRGVMLNQMGQGQEGAELIRQALAIVTDNAGMQMNYGNVLREIGRRDEAEKAYHAAIHLDPENADAYCNLGALLRLKKDFEGSRSALAKAIELNPRHGEAFCNLGNLLRDVGDLEGAIESYEKSVTFDGHRAIRGKAAASLAGVLRRSGKTEQAIKVLKEWLAREPDSPTASHLLAALSQTDVPGRANDAYVKELFDGFARSFDDVLESLHYRAPKLIGTLLNDLGLNRNRELRILDLGCGTGLGGEVVAPYAGKLVGVDISSVMLAKAAQRNLYDDLVEAEITRFLDSPGGDFDLVISVDALCYFGDLEAVLRGVSRVLAPGSFFCFTVEKTLISEHGLGYRLEQHGRYAHQKSYLQQTCTTAGLEVERVQEVILRLETGQPVNGFVVAAKAPAP